ncbi:electron transfer flavoprotein subunit beta/FixA family protein [Fluoribacter dumoffii]|uniref:Electron transfer flavoprotein subunit beta n=1 Tax=Fluoribacter dumoffii TaxID=463 RepID=A0A377G7N4_9GAMM|nr:electron transfer flavoprotein subunit beta/FixA family protein [Fluoribacter dumoffii]KTC89720.1 electron transfer flavoprotein beta-subunit (Beta-ETF) [Fluoribacter dumoffii NY 23]MCW8384914.1 electron transfer flavoprotein subunit beta/FixA family protein [Fluoribacter dumoffii]MCW8417976.1 electron transfer flavoprotein subunit beta/FixA family protein [Fluoribacter dumoffii]MCW8454182.1 electron transfer flavoprotein subunit beta/FixA family protein [Fluoribacter dumoffii]MCW8461744.1 
MKVLVAVKRVIDPYVKIRVKSDHSGVETQNIKMAMNPFDEIAVEEALRLREKNWATEVIAVCIGGDSSQETLRHALALGVDRAILVQTQDSLESLNIAKILKKIVEDEKPNLVLMGKQAIDGDNNQTPQMLAALLNWPQATYASKIEPQGEQLMVTREIDGGLETISVRLPAVVSSDLRLNEPRYASLPNIMKAKKKPLDVLRLENMGLSLKKHVEILKVTAPAVRSAGVKVESVTELLDKLQHEAKVL